MEHSSHSPDSDSDHKTLSPQIDAANRIADVNTGLIAAVCGMLTVVATTGGIVLGKLMHTAENEALRRERDNDLQFSKGVVDAVLALKDIEHGVDKTMANDRLTPKQKLEALEELALRIALVEGGRNQPIFEHATKDLQILRNTVWQHLQLQIAVLRQVAPQLQEQVNKDD